MRRRPPPRTFLGSLLRFFEDLIAAVAVLLILLGLGFVWLGHWYHEQVERWRIERMPAKLGITETSYFAENDEPPLPSANANGVAVHPLPSASLSAIEHEGVTYFADMEREWMPTPVVEDEHWPEKRSTSYHTMLERWLYRWPGRHLDIDEDVADAINASMQETDNYYTYFGNGVLIVSPGRRSAYFFFAD